MTDLLIFDAFGVQIGTYSAPYTDEKVEEDLENKNTFSFTVALEEENVKDYFVVGNRVALQYDNQDKIFFISSIEDESKSISVPIRKVTCSGIHLELLFNLVTFSYTGTNLNTIFGNAIYGSDWSLSIEGEIDTPSDMEPPQISYTLANSIKALNELSSLFQVELYYTADVVDGNITNKTVHVIKSRGTVIEQTFTLSNAIESLTKSVDYTGIINRLYAKGAVTSTVNGVETYVNIADVEWLVSEGKPINKPLGQLYFEDLASIEKYGIKEGVSSHNTDNIYFLTMATYRHLQDAKNPKASYEVDLVDLFRLEDDENYHVSLGDTIPVFDSDLNLNISVRITGVSYNPNDATTVKFKLDNYTDLIDVDTIQQIKEDTANAQNPPFVNDWNSSRPVEGDDSIVVVKAAYKGTSGAVYLGYDAKANEATALSAYKGNDRVIHITNDGDGTFKGTVEASTINGGVINGTEINGTTINGGEINGAVMNGTEINTPDITIGDEEHQRMHLHSIEGVPFLDVYDSNGDKTLSIYQRGLSFSNKSNFVSYTVGSRTGIGIFTI